MELYIYGCQTCGVNSVYIRRVKAHCLRAGLDLAINNTKYDKESLFKHAEYLKQMGLSGDSYEPIVVEQDKVTHLREWY